MSEPENVITSHSPSEVVEVVSGGLVFRQSSELGLEVKSYADGTRRLVARVSDVCIFDRHLSASEAAHLARLLMPEPVEVSE